MSAIAPALLVVDEAADEFELLFEEQPPLKTNKSATKQINNTLNLFINTLFSFIVKNSHNEYAYF